MMSPCIPHSCAYCRKIVIKNLFQTGYAWEDVVEQYSSWCVTVPGGKLIALAALKKEIGTGFYITYLAGLWKIIFLCYCPGISYTKMARY
jgi:hypothetical protein